MKIFKLLAVAVIALSIHVSAFAKPDPDNYTLTPAFLAKMKAIEAEGKQLKAAMKDDDDEGEQSIEDAIRKIENTPGAKALLARHGLTATEAVVGMYATLHAGMYVAFESSMDKKKAAELYNTYTKAQKANIVFMRTQAGPKKK